MAKKKAAEARLAAMMGAGIIPHKPNPADDDAEEEKDESNRGALVRKKKNKNKN